MVIQSGNLTLSAWIEYSIKNKWKYIPIENSGTNDVGRIGYGYGTGGVGVRGDKWNTPNYMFTWYAYGLVGIYMGKLIYAKCSK